MCCVCVCVLCEWGNNLFVFRVGVYRWVVNNVKDRRGEVVCDGVVWYIVRVVRVVRGGVGVVVRVIYFDSCLGFVG